MGGEHTFDDIDGAATVLEAMVSHLDVATLIGAGATRLVERLVTAERVLAATRARAARRAAEANQWRHTGERSAASWLARLTGTTPGHAAAELETTAQLNALPATDAARRSGALSELQAREIAAAATADPTAEAELLRRSKIDDAKALRRRCAAIRAAAERDEAAARERIRKARRFRSWTDAEGAFCFAGRGLPEDGAALLAAMKPHQDKAFHAARRQGGREGTDAYAYDGLMGLIRHSRDHRCPTSPSRADGRHGQQLLDDERPGDADAAAPGGDAGTCAPAAHGQGGSEQQSDDATWSPANAQGESGQPATSDEATRKAWVTPGPQAKLIVRIDHAALVRGHTIPGEVCEIAGIGPIPVATARELARDAFLTAAVIDGFDVSTVVHLGRSATAHQRTALEARGMVCAVPGCGIVHGLEIDHVDGWAITRKTRVEHLDWLCHFHHGQKTHKSYRLEGPPGNRTWHPPGPAEPPTG